MNKKNKGVLKGFSSKYFCFWNNQFSSAAQRRPRPIHKNAKFGAHPSSPPLGFNMAWGGRQKKSFKKTLEMSCNEFNKKSLTPPPLRGWSGGKINCVQEILEMSWNEKKLKWFWPRPGGGSKNLNKVLNFLYHYILKKKMFLYQFFLFNQKKFWTRISMNSRWTLGQHYTNTDELLINSRWTLDEL